MTDHAPPTPDQEATALLMLAMGLTIVKVCRATEQTWTPVLFARALAGYAGAMVRESDGEPMPRLVAELLSLVMTGIDRALTAEGVRLETLEAQVNEAFNEGLSIFDDDG